MPGRLDTRGIKPCVGIKTKTQANLDKNHFLANARKQFLRDNDANLINPLVISSTLRRNKQNEISIRLTHEIDIRMSFSRNETMRPDEIREGHRKGIRTIQPILDTWTASGQKNPIKCWTESCIGVDLGVLYPGADPYPPSATLIFS
ncbi:hypothetical protein HGM15179_008140 [Zosterops borbonicus]|uniref:Uncharacterized protein n=1 Tax=Zosterops borbonicus TaxID=364589 RepID=A0A8K1LMI0_9PASS|nr:hypothetical protein HGM15179_008140 [Zosterops borbonicus]